MVPRKRLRTTPSIPFGFLHEAYYFINVYIIITTFNITMLNTLYKIIKFFININYINSLETVGLMTEEFSGVLLNNLGLVDWSNHCDYYINNNFDIKKNSLILQ